ncbi:hypothetical protein [Telluribacter sp. SYSU D00476]|uniref:hypothetical protein n=1 Tax=Telluribacter sp. SYSU D00476 TaxID=2811430 RepID=UPI001FF22E14|nr:hypothetical protein [Telluribacter sp. SYSU D00476]
MLTFDYSPLIYWAVGYLLAGVVIWAGVSQRISNLAYLCLSIVLLVMMRLPAVVMNRELNPDESQMISHGITLYYSPIYWQSVDGTTIGPLDNYLLVVPRLLGFQVDYTSARVMGLLCAVGALLFFFGAVRRWFGSSTARVALLFPLLFLAFTQEPDYVHYSSEQLPAFLLGFCLYMLARLSTSRSLSARWAYLLGFVAGMVPFAKLQAVPQAAVLALAGIWVAYHYFRSDRQYRPLAAILLGGLSFPLLVVAWTLYHEVFDDMIDFYLLGNAIYAGNSSFTSIPTYLFRLLSLSPDFLVYFILLLIPVGVGVVRWRKPASSPAEPRQAFLPWLMVGYLLAALYAATKSGNPFVHYLTLCIHPLALAAVCGLHELRKQRVAWSLVLPGVWVLWFAGMDGLSAIRYRQVNAFNSIGATALPESALVSEIKKHTEPGDYLVVWGWHLLYYVEAQLPQGTAENHSERSIFVHPLRDTYRARYISNMKTNRPAVFVDAVDNSLWLGNRATEGYESFPELAQYIKQNYHYVGTYDKNLLFIRKDKYQPK